MNITKGAFTIIINTDNKILLLKRQDYPLWDLPGGRLEPNETIEDCAKREAYEETGYHICVNYKVGTYNRSKYSDIQHIFHGTIVSGKPISSGNETKELRWFSLNKLPLNMVPNRRKQIMVLKNNFKDREINLKDRNLLLYFHKITK
ncbi:MAG: NUDIX hydrolase [Erysipelotrichaceae bacterium]|nr:NUDIX hydrolase [Erysipelotrichaceae bacterium]